jgi:hypothetical protein
MVVTLSLFFYPFFSLRNYYFFTSLSSLSYVSYFVLKQIVLTSNRFVRRKRAFYQPEKITGKAPHCNENLIKVFLFGELPGLSPNFHIHVSVSDLYIPRIGLHISYSRKGRSLPTHFSGYLSASLSLVQIWTEICKWYNYHEVLCILYTVS